ncbi:MAG: 30S ribosomal protein S13 [Chlamydiia bacterium]|nr:30S ribosomal protein S13 [Chlamydiia bacterium]
MARILGKEIPDSKRICISLRYIYGIGPTTSDKILENLNIDPNKRTKDVSEEDFARIIKELDKYVIEGELRRTVNSNIKRLMDIRCYRGVRHRLRLPVRGQKTQKNARTRKGPKRTVANKKK